MFPPFYASLPLPKQGQAFFSSFEWGKILHSEPPSIPSAAASSLINEPMRDGKAEDWSLEADAMPLSIEDISSFNGGVLMTRRVSDGYESPKGDTWDKFLRPGEACVLTNLVWKRNGLISKRRQLILTNQKRLLYVNPRSMEFKGEVPWSDEAPIR